VPPATLPIRTFHALPDGQARHPVRIPATSMKYSRLLFITFVVFSLFFAKNVAGDEEVVKPSLPGLDADAFAKLQAEKAQKFEFQTEVSRMLKYVSTPSLLA